jgi:hypothetical protein
MTTRKLPLWKTVVYEEIKDTLTFGTEWKFEWLEEKLEEKRDSQEFMFDMMELCGHVLEETGKYVERDSSAGCYRVRNEEGQEAKAKSLDAMPRRALLKSINIRSSLLADPVAQLSEQQRADIDKGLETATKKLLMISRSASISDLVAKHKPKLLKKGR